MKLKLALVATFTAFTLAVAGCTSPAAEESLPPITAPTAVATPQVNDELKPFYTQVVEWESCGTRILCGSVSVPTNWADPSAGSLSLAVAYRAADIAKPLGSIIFNPGGPGSSGYDWILSSVDYLGTKNLRSKFNIVGFDPRGVGQSEPRVKCFDAKKTDALLYDDNGFPLDAPIIGQQMRTATNTAVDEQRNRIKREAFRPQTQPGEALAPLPSLEEAERARKRHAQAYAGVVDPMADVRATPTELSQPAS